MATAAQPPATQPPAAEPSAPRKVPLHKYFASSITLITSAAPGRTPNVMACEWTMNVSYQPLLVLALVERADYTHELITASGEFGVNRCSSAQTGLVDFAGRNTGWKVDKLDAPEFAGLVYQGKKISAPMIKGCVLNLECVVEQTTEIGDYTAFVGRAVAARRDDEADPLVYFRGKYFHLGDAVSPNGGAK